MDGSKDKKHVYRSMREFEMEFFPESFEKKMLETPTDAQALGVSLAKESLDKIRGQLAK